MKRATRVTKANETLEIIEKGFYTVDGKTLDISGDLKASLDASALFRSDDFGAVMESAEQKTRSLTLTPRIAVENITVLEGATQLTARGQRTGCLNFASAKNPGGGFLNGAQAQEESLAVSSALYASQMKHFELYQYNRNRHTLLYSDHMIYSPDVVVFRDDSGELLPQPYRLAIVTSPATNVGAMRVNAPDELEKVEETMLQRMDKVLALFVHHDIKQLLLGAWGCGVFQNDPAHIARWFAHYLCNGGKYAGCFEQVLFAVYDKSKDQENINAFTKQFR